MHMNYLNKMRREDHIANIGMAGRARQRAGGCSGIVRSAFIEEAKAMLRWAADDRRFAAAAGWKLP
jgi:hypothetical protein